MIASDRTTLGEKVVVLCVTAVFVAPVVAFIAALAGAR